MKSECENEKPIQVRRRQMLALVSLLLLSCFFLAGDELVQEDQKLTSRYQTYTAIFETATEGYLFQTAPNSAMESTWGDPGMGFFLSLLGMVDFLLGVHGPGLDGIYMIELAVLVVVLILPFWRRMFQLPAVYYIVPPLFIVTAFVTPRPLLFWSFKPYWASTAAAFWVSTVLLHYS